MTMTTTRTRSTAPMTHQSTYKLEAPDGGWGILVCIGMALPFISALAALPSFGLIFGDFLRSIGAQTSTIAFVTSAFFCALSFAGLFSGSLFRRWGLRPVGLVGGILYALGSLLQVFVMNAWQLTIAFSIVQGVGFGLIVPTAYTTFNNYFVKNRIMWMSFAQTLIGLGCMLYPIVMQKLLDWYGFRGCLLILAGLNTHAVLGMLLMQPVEWHMRRVPLTDAELQERQPVLRVIQETPLPKAEHEQPPNFARQSKAKANSSHLAVPTNGAGDGAQHVAREDLHMVSRRASSITSLGNWSGHVVVSDASPQMMHSLQASRRASVAGPATVAPTATATQSAWQTLVDFLDLSLLRQGVYVNIVLGISFALYSDITFFMLQPIYLFQLGFSRLDTATIIAIGAAADLASRIFLAVTAVFIQMPSRYIYLAGAFFTVIARFAFVGVNDYLGMVCITAVLGFLRTWVHVPLPLVFADYLPKERFASGYGLFMFLQGNIMFAVSPIIGYVRDKTNDYILAFHLLNFCMVLCAGPWLVEIICIKFRRRNRIERNNVEHDNVLDTL